MRALTLHAPWAWAIAHLDKRTENRTWRPSLKRLRPGDWFAIHAGMKNTADGRLRVAITAGAAGWRNFPVPDGDLVIKRRHDAERLGPGIDCGCIVAVARYAGADRDMIDGWDAPDCWHWRLQEVRPLFPVVPCKGRLGLWHLPDDVAAAVATQVGELP